MIFLILVYMYSILQSFFLAEIFFFFSPFSRLVLTCSSHGLEFRLGSWNSGLEIWGQVSCLCFLVPAPSQVPGYMPASLPRMTAK